MGNAGALKGRGRLSSIDLMPSECDGIIHWAAQQLAARERTQTEIYAEFVERCEALMAEHRGELEFDIPSFSSFNRYAFRNARLSRRLDQIREITAVLAEKYDASSSDDLTVMTAETIKSVTLHVLAEADEDGLDPKALMHLASAFRQAVYAQAVSSDRKRKLEADFEAKVGSAVETVARARGITAETAEAIKAQILGVGA